MKDERDSKVQDLVVVTGPAGAGRSTAINALEDCGFEAIDNLPLTLLQTIVTGAPFEQPIAVGIDARTRGFSPEKLVEMLSAIAASGDVRPTLLYVDCGAETLLRRFSETRRRHPLAPSDSPRDGVIREQTMLEPLRRASDILIDTTDMSPHDLRHEVAGWFEDVAVSELSIVVQSFSYKRGIPRGSDMVMDLRFLRNPHWDPDLRPLDGRDPAVAAYVSADPSYPAFFDTLFELIQTLLPAYKAEGKAYFTLALGCTGGQHRSVFVTEAMAKGLAEKGWRVSIRHRELESRAN